MSTPTLRDVAEAAGVHAATASRALNPETRRLVNSDTARRVIKAAEALGYQPNPIARSLKTSKSGTIGLVLPDTRSWRLEPHAGTSPAVAALLRWRKAERTATTYGWAWLDRHVGPDGRLRGEWRAADGAGGRMTASAGLHNLPAELRPAVLAQACVGYLSLRARGRARRPGGVLAVADLDLPNATPRLWVIDLNKPQVLHHSLVAHGRGSGQPRARRFSDVSGSACSSLGTVSTCPAA